MGRDAGEFGDVWRRRLGQVKGGRFVVDHGFNLPAESLVRWTRHGARRARLGGGPIAGAARVCGVHLAAGREEWAIVSAQRDFTSPRLAILGGGPGGYEAAMVAPTSARRSPSSNGRAWAAPPC